MEWLILAVLAAYCIWVIVRRIRKWKRGEFCDCGCESCKKCK